MVTPILLIATLALDFYFACFIWLRNHVSKTNTTLARFMFFSGLWSGGIFMLQMYPQKFWIQFTYLAATLLVWSFMSATENFPKENNRIFRMRFLWHAVALFFVLVDIFKIDWLIYDVISHGSWIEAKRGILYIWFVFYVLLYIFIGIRNLLKNYQHEDVVGKIQVRYALAGLIFFAFLAMTTNSLLTFFNYNKLNGLGPFFSLIFVFMTVYAFTRFRFLDTKIIIKKISLIIVAVVFEVIALIILFQKMFHVDFQWYFGSMQHAMWIVFVLLIFFFGWYFLTNKIFNLFWKTEQILPSKKFQQLFIQHVTKYELQEFHRRLEKAIYKDFQVEKVDFYIIKNNEEIVYDSEKKYRDIGAKIFLKDITKEILITRAEINYRPELDKYKNILEKLFKNTGKNAFMFCGSIWGFDILLLLRMAHESQGKEVLKQIESSCETICRIIGNIYAYQKSLFHIKTKK